MRDFVNTSPFFVHASQPADLDDAWKRSLPRCVGNCNQGRSACESPQECLGGAVRDELSQTWADSGHGALEETHRRAEPWAWLAIGALVLLVVMVAA